MTHPTSAGPVRHSARSMARAGGLHDLGVHVLLAGAFLPIADFFIVNVALPTIQASPKAPAALDFGHCLRVRPSLLACAGLPACRASCPAGVIQGSNKAAPDNEIRRACYFREQYAHEIAARMQDFGNEELAEGLPSIRSAAPERRQRLENGRPPANA
ncbi:MAG: hypothetical protein E5V64_30110 [Mesorhizobium sp.]|nr:hypothetical protein [Mesorhizobium sp.]TIV77576.1 MAG: hypothetical protein E5V64_30110 [Mesorhizobium sp.]TIX72515.1 MAG: hypothetical protein E5V30_05675 [Mesorhizobium sp.]